MNWYSPLDRPYSPEAHETTRWWVPWGAASPLLRLPCLGVVVPVCTDKTTADQKSSTSLTHLQRNHGSAVQHLPQHSLGGSWCVECGDVCEQLRPEDRQMKYGCKAEAFHVPNGFLITLEALHAYGSSWQHLQQQQQQPPNQSEYH
jgi:hypothetical protein